MSRPTKPRRICTEPICVDFAPTKDTKVGENDIIMTYDELEAMRLIDLERISQEECAERMNVARTTAQAIYNSARQKTAKSIVYGYKLHISGGNYKICNGKANCGGCNQHENQEEL